MAEQSKNFGLIGVAGYIAVRHLAAIKETGNRLLASLDPFDSVGIIDSYFPESDFFVEFERFDRHFEKLKRHGTKIDYVSICSPNYLHDSHIRFGLRHQSDAICEKPIVLNPWNIEALQEIEIETGRKVYTILQLRLHPSIIELKKRVDAAGPGKIYDVDLSYITTRGNWYRFSWKGDVQKSGGVATNIGVHFFDMLTWIFGKEKSNIVHLSKPDKAGGYLELEKARVRWFLSLDAGDLPSSSRAAGQRTYRSVVIEGEEIEFSSGFTDLHNQSYLDILSGGGFGLEDAKRSVEIVHTIRTASVESGRGEIHPLVKNLIK